MVQNTDAKKQFWQRGLEHWTQYTEKGQKYIQQEIKTLSAPSGNRIIELLCSLNGGADRINADFCHSTH